MTPERTTLSASAKTSVLLTPNERVVSLGHVRCALIIAINSSAEVLVYHAMPEDRFYQDRRNGFYQTALKPQTLWENSGSVFAVLAHVSQSTGPADSHVTVFANKHRYPWKLAVDGTWRDIDQVTRKLLAFAQNEDANPSLVWQESHRQAYARYGIDIANLRLVQPTYIHFNAYKHGFDVEVAHLGNTVAIQIVSSSKKSELLHSQQIPVK